MTHRPANGKRRWIFPGQHRFASRTSARNSLVPGQKPGCWASQNTFCPITSVRQLRGTERADTSENGDQKGPNSNVDSVNKGNGLETQGRIFPKHNIISEAVAGGVVPWTLTRSQKTQDIGDNSFTQNPRKNADDKGATDYIAMGRVSLPRLQICSEKTPKNWLFSLALS